MGCLSFLVTVPACVVGVLKLTWWIRARRALALRSDTFMPGLEMSPSMATAAAALAKQEMTEDKWPPLPPSVALAGGCAPEGVCGPDSSSSASAARHGAVGPSSSSEEIQIHVTCDRPG